MQVEAVLFDLFDTLVLIEKNKDYYTPSLIKLHDSLAKNRVNIPFEDFKRAYFEVRDRLYADTEKSLDEPHFNVRVMQVLQQFGYDFDVSAPVIKGATKAFADEFMHYVHLDNNAIDVLEALRREYKLGLISNFAIPECAWRILEKFDLKKFFDVIVVSGAINKRKPSPDIFEKALNTLDVEASRAVFIGDMVGLDVIGAKNVGMKSVLIERRPSREGRHIEPDRIIKSLRELLGMINGY